MEIVCFHNPDEDNGYLSNWYPSAFTTEGICFSSMEQYMMYKKAVVFGDAAIANRIMASEDVAEIKALGRAVRNYSDLNTLTGVVPEKCSFSESLAITALYIKYTSKTMYFRAW